MAVSGKGYALTGLLRKGAKISGRSTLLLPAKSGINAATYLVIDDLLFTSAAVGYTLTAQGASYTGTTPSSTINKTKLIVASGGSYILTGQNTGITRSKLLIATGGSYTLTGQQVSITYTPVTGYNLTAQGGLYTISGQSVTLLKSKNIVTNGGTYTLAGQSASLYKSRVLNSQGGSYTYTSSSITITYTSPYPSPSDVLLGVIYGPGDIYTGTYNYQGLKIDINSGKIIKPLTAKLAITL